MTLELYDSAQVVQTFGLNPCFRLKIDGTSFEKGLNKYYGRDGGYVLGDGTAQAVQLKLVYDSIASNDQAFLSESKQVLEFLRSGNGPYYLRLTPDVGTIPPLRWRVDYTKFGNQMDDGLELRSHDRSISLWALDANAEYDTALDTGAVVMQDGDTLDVPNPGDGEAFPIIQVIALGNIQNFTLFNAAAKLEFTVDDFSFTAGKKYSFDFIDGAIRLFNVGFTSSVERSKAISSGGPWGLRPGNNQLMYTSLAGDVSVQLTYRPPLHLF